MSTSHLRCKVAAVTVAALATAPGVALTAPGATAAPATAPAITSSVDFDYFADVFPSLADQRDQHVFESISIERLKYLLRFKTGKYAILIGDPKDASTQAEIASINTAAKSIGVTKIYVFNPRIDGEKLNIFDWSELSSVLGGAGLTYWESEGAAGTTGGPLIDLINGDATSPEFVRDDSGKVTSPYLFVLDPQGKDGAGKDDRVVSSLSDRKSAADLDTPAERTAYEAEVKQTLLDGGAVTAPDLSVTTQFAFYEDEVNRRHTTSYADEAKYGGNILSAADDTDGWRIQQLTYPETIDLLSNPRYKDADVPLLFGGTWCHNTRAVIKNINADAQANGVKTVYNLDFSLFSVGNGGTVYDHIRTSGDPKLDTASGKLLAPGHLYGDLFNTYLYNAKAEYAADGEPGASANRYYPGGDTTQAVRSARRLQVPALLVYNQSHKDALGDAAPVVDEAIRTNADGTYTEYMSEYWYVAGHALPNTADTTLYGTLAAGGDRLQNARDFATEALGAYQDVLGSLGSVRYTSTTHVTVGDTGSTDLVPGTAPTLSVTVTAAGYGPFFTNNKSAVDVPRSAGIAGPTGSVVVRDAAGQLVGDPVALNRDGSPVTVTLPTVSTADLGKSWKVEYLGRGYSITSSSTALPVREHASVSLTGSRSSTYGKAATVTVKVTDSAGRAATGTVSLAGAGTTRSATLSSAGQAVITLPATLAVGSYALTATYAGSSAVTGATASTTLTVTKAKVTAVKTKVKKAPTTKKAGKAKITVTTAKGLAKATGKVTVTLKKGKKSVKVKAIVKAGKATVKLPKSAKGTWKAKTKYAGSSTYAAAKAKAVKVKVKK